MKNSTRGRAFPRTSTVLGPCEVCGSAGTVAVQDLLRMRIFGVESIGGGNRHVFCEAHKRDSKVDNFDLWKDLIDSPREARKNSN